ncbi:MAG: GspE/PulE family protein [Opitutales bacterium]|nr:GspE/PulE family protein [Opitutales bacterium]
MLSITEEEKEELEEISRSEKLRWLAQKRQETYSSLIGDLADSCNFPFLEVLKVKESPTDYLPFRIITEFQILPIEKDGDEGRLPVAVGWYPDAAMEKWIYSISGKRVEWHVADPELINRTIQQRFGVGSASLEDGGLEELGESDVFDEDDEDQNAAVIRFINDIIEQAVRDRATDIHFEPGKDNLQIRYRIDGELVFVTVPDNLVRIKGAIISRIKIMARLNISEKRRPQDGRINYHLGGHDLDIRISTFPTMYGESISMRLLNQKQQPLTLSEIGLLEDDQARVSRVLMRPHGIVLVTGPTGSGKSTTLNAFLRQINAPERRIITVEDPIEYEVEGVNQTQIKPEIGLNFATALRHILRQDPDVIMVGEIRDRETAEIAIRASLTGHMVLSTIHTNDASGAITRLIDMDIEPFLIASAVEQVLAQRLVRRLDPSMSTSANVDNEFLETCLRTLGISITEAAHKSKLLEPKIAGGAQNVGYYGRVGIFEVMTNNDELHELIVKKAPAKELRNMAMRQGMRTLQACGWEQVKLGRTSLSEIMKFSSLGSDQ